VVCFGHERAGSAPSRDLLDPAEGRPLDTCFARPKVDRSGSFIT